MHRLRARGFENFLYVTGLLDEAGVAWKPVGGNELLVPDDTFTRMSAEQLTELAGATRNPVEAPADVPPPVAPAADAVAAPPRSGAGSGRDAWAAYADSLGIEVPDDMTRDDIIALVEQQEAHGGS